MHRSKNRMRSRSEHQARIAGSFSRRAGRVVRAASAVFFSSYWLIGYSGTVKGTSVGLGLQSVLRDFEVNVGLTAKSDATAAVAMASRRGVGKVRHIEVCQLWLQDTLRRGYIKVVKACTHENVADALTKYVSQVVQALPLIGQEGWLRREGCVAVLPPGARRDSSAEALPKDTREVQNHG